jgi:hypothetical protein
MWVPSQNDKPRIELFMPPTPTTLPLRSVKHEANRFITQKMLRFEYHKNALDLTLTIKEYKGYCAYSNIINEIPFPKQ